MRIDPILQKMTKKEKLAYDQAQLEKKTKFAAIALSFVSVFYFFIKLLFL